MANKKVTLLRYANLPGVGWRRGVAVLGKTGKVVPNVMLLGQRGEQTRVDAPDGRYELRYYEGKLPRYKALGNDPTEALEELSRAQNNLKLKNTAEAAGFILPNVREPKRKPLAEYGREFLELKRSLNLSDDSNYLYTSIVEEFLPVCGRTYPDDVTEADVIRYCNHLEKRFSDRSRANWYTSLRGFLFYCGLEPKRLITPSVHKKLKSFEKKRVRLYSGEEIRKLLNICDPYHHALFLTALLTGMRENELAHVLWRMVDFEANVIHLEHYKIAHKGKTIEFQLKDAEARDVPLFPALREELSRWRKTRSKSMFVLGTSNDLPNVKILDALKRKVRKAGLNCELCMGCAARKECHRFHTHYFRSSFASYALERNHIRKVQAWMGHSDLETLSKYVGLADRCPEWLASLYVERQTISSPQEEIMPASIVLPSSEIPTK